MARSLFVLFLLIGGLLACRQKGSVDPAVPPPLTPDFELNGAGTNIDSIAFWETAVAVETLMFVTSKGEPLVEIWQFPFMNNEQTPLTHTTFGNSAAKVNGIAIDQENDLLYIVISEPQLTVSIFSLPDLIFQKQFVGGAVDLKGEPNIDLLTDKDGTIHAYISADDTLYIYETSSGRAISQFMPEKGLETILADDWQQIIYIPDENERTGIYAYTPAGEPYPTAGHNQFGTAVFQADAEGITLYHCLSDGSDNGAGFIIVADQINEQSDFEFFDRQSWAHLGTLRIKGVSNTDGIASTQLVLPDYPLGILAVINDDTSVVGIGWDKVLAALGLGCAEATAVDNDHGFSNIHKSSSRK